MKLRNLIEKFTWYWIWSNHREKMDMSETYRKEREKIMVESL